MPDTCSTFIARDARYSLASLKLLVASDRAISCSNACRLASSAAMTMCLASSAVPGDRTFWLIMPSCSSGIETPKTTSPPPPRSKSRSPTFSPVGS